MWPTVQKKCPKQHIKSCGYQKIARIQKKCVCKHTNNSSHIIINGQIFNLEHTVNTVRPGFIISNRNLSNSKQRKPKKTRVDTKNLNCVKFMY